MFGDDIQLSFAYNEYSDTTTINVGRTIKGEEAQYLHRVLSEFKYFLQSVGFSNVESIIVLDTDGDEVASSDLF